MVTLNNADDLYNGSNADITVDAGTIVTINGSDDTVTAGLYAETTITGGGNTIQAAQGVVSVYGTNGVFDVLTASNVQLAIGDDTQLILYGSILPITVGADSVVVATGDNTSFAASDDRIYISAANVGGDSISGVDNRAIVAAKSLLDVYGDDNYVHLEDDSAVYVQGTGERLVGAGFGTLAASGSEFWIGGNANGAFDRVKVDDCTIKIGPAANIALQGDDDNIVACTKSYVIIEGAGTTAHFGRDSQVVVTGNGATGVADSLNGASFTVSITANSNATVAAFKDTVAVADDSTLTLSRSYNTVTAGASDTISILFGLSNQVTLGQSDVINDAGSATVFQVQSDVGTTTINGFGDDWGGIVELLTGAGGYATGAAAYAALTSDGAGGSLLSLGSQGSIDFAGTAASELSAASFKIG